MGNETIEEKIREYNRINDSFSKKVVFHVGDGAGFYSELNAMMQCMLWCYSKKIKFELYADDANFTSGHGWNVFFEPFCYENHNRLNHYGNHRSNLTLRAHKNFIEFKVAEYILRHFYHIDYLTQDIFPIAIDRAVSQVEVVDCDIFDVHGVNYVEFAKLIKYVMRFNVPTREAINQKINSLTLPDNYVSVQIRGGDKTTEYEKLNDVDIIMERVIENSDKLNNLFVFTDDYRYITYIKEKYADIHVYTLTKESEVGYVNEKFQKTAWDDKYDNMIKLFAMVEVCLKSDIHFGNEYTCVNQYIKYSRLLEEKRYMPVWSREESIQK